MDQFNHHSSNSLSLDQLVSRALDRLKQIGCSKRSLRRYQTIWEHLIEFSHQKQLGDEYSENLATRFIGEYRLKEGEDVKRRYGWQRHIVFSMKVIGDFAHDRRIERCVTDMQKIHVPPVMKNALRDYEQFCKDRWHLRSTSLRATIREVTIFLNFLRLRKLETLDRIQATDLSAFVSSRNHLRPTTISRTVSNMRLFLRFFTLRGILQMDLSLALPKIRVSRSRDAALPSVWDHELIVKLLDLFFIERQSTESPKSCQS